jgi:hypothetical protein
MRKFSIVAISIMLLCLAVPLCAQGERGAITGSITDSSGAATPYVDVIAIDIETGVESKAVTTETGLYRMPYLPPATYRVSASLALFKTALLRAVQVSVASVVTANLALELGDVNQSITVSSEGTHLETASSEVGYSVSSQDYHLWPIDSNDDGQRQIQSFIFQSLPGTHGDSYQGSINGGPTFSHEVYIEGMSLRRADIAGDTAEFTPSVDAISEFRLQTGGLSAQYGGGLTAVANFNVKSGTNELHGSAYNSGPRVLQMALDIPPSRRIELLRQAVDQDPANPLFVLFPRHKLREGGAPRRCHESVPDRVAKRN